MRDENDSLEINGQRHQMDGLSQLIEQGVNFAQQFVQGFHGNQCQRPQEKKEEKKEETKVEPKVETKPEPFQKMPKKTEEKKVEVVEAQKVEVPKKEEPVTQKPTEEKKKEDIKEQREHMTVEGANYLSELMNMSFTKAYKFASMYPMHPKEQLLDLYLSQLK